MSGSSRRGSSGTGRRGVKGIMERRAGDRQAAQYPVADERRLVRRRRIRQGEVASLGYTISIVLAGEFTGL